MQLGKILQVYNSYILLGLVFTCLLLLILCIIALVSIVSLKKRINRFMGQTTGEQDIEKLLISYLDRVNEVDDRYDTVISDIKNINHRLQFCIQKLGMVRYNPFEEVGGDLCFALTLLDEKNNGVIINTIFSRSATYTYGKPVKKGESTYTLSEEEKQSLQMALAGER